MNILEHIFTEFVDYIPRPDSGSNEYHTLLTSYSDLMDAFVPKLPPTQKKAFWELESQRNLLAAMDEENMFIYGFRIGAKLMLDILFQPEL